MACRVRNGAGLNARHANPGCLAAGMNDFAGSPASLRRLREGLPAADAVTLDTAFLQQLCLDIGADGVSEMARIFLEDAPHRMAAIRRGMANGSIQTVRREAHALAGAAGCVGLRRLSEAAYALQIASEQAAPAEATVEAVAGALRHVLPLLTYWAAEVHDAAAPWGA